MNAVRIHPRIESETLHLAELKPFIGKRVELLVREDAPLETRETFLSSGPEWPPAPPEEWEQMREMAKTDPTFAAFLAVAGTDVLDLDAIIAARGR